MGPAMPLLPVNSPSSSPERNDTDAFNNSKDTGERDSKLPVNSPSSSPERNDTDAFNNSKGIGGRGSKLPVNSPSSSPERNDITIIYIEVVLAGIVVGLGV